VSVEFVDQDDYFDDDSDVPSHCDPLEELDELLAGFGCVWVFTLLTQVEAVPKYGMIQVVI
jgi:hypothetical protein